MRQQQAEEVVSPDDLEKLDFSQFVYPDGTPSRESVALDLEPSLSAADVVFNRVLGETTCSPPDTRVQLLPHTADMVLDGVWLGRRDGGEQDGVSYVRQTDKCAKFELCWDKSHRLVSYFDAGSDNLIVYNEGEVDMLLVAPKTDAKEKGPSETRRLGVGEGAVVHPGFWGIVAADGDSSPKQLLVECFLLHRNFIVKELSAMGIAADTETSKVC